MRSALSRPTVLAIAAALALAGCSTDRDPGKASPPAVSDVATPSPTSDSDDGTPSPSPVPTAKELTHFLLAEGGAQGLWRASRENRTSVRWSPGSWVESALSIGREYQSPDCRTRVDLPESTAAVTTATWVVDSAPDSATQPKGDADRRGPYGQEVLLAKHPATSAAKFDQIREAWTGCVGEFPFTERGRKGFIRLELMDIGSVGEDRIALRVRDIGPNSGDHGWTADNFWWAVVRDGPVLLFLNVRDGWVSGSASHWPKTYPKPGMSDDYFRAIVTAAVDKLP